jgi:hypothetical protein
MLQTRLHVDMWEESCNYGWHTHNLYPPTRYVIWEEVNHSYTEAADAPYALSLSMS